MHPYRLILAVGLALVTADFTTPSYATDNSQARDICNQRGPQCKSFGLKDGVLYCVDNRSTGHGVQCVHCKSGQQCTVLRPALVGGKTRAEAALTNR